MRSRESSCKKSRIEFPAGAACFGIWCFIPVLSGLIPDACRPQLFSLLFIHYSSYIHIAFVEDGGVGVVDIYVA